MYFHFLSFGQRYYHCLENIGYNGQYLFHTTSYCQAKPQSQLSWAELALLLISPAAHPPGRTSSELAGNQLNLLCNICRSTQVHLKTSFQFLKIWKTSYRKDNFNKR